jgi:hypothetical protein
MGFLFSETYVKKFLKTLDCQIYAYFFSSFGDCRVFNNFVIFD